MRRRPNTMIYKNKKLNTSPEFFIRVFQNRLHRTPDEYIDEKLAAGSKLDAIRYLFDIQAAAISQVNNCKFYDFYYFYNRRSNNNKPTPPENHKINRLENVGKIWTKEEEQLLIKMYNSSATKSEICNTFKRTENGLAIRLVRLGVIEDKDVFFNRK